MKIFTFFSEKPDPVEKLSDEKLVVEDDYESLVDLIARVCRGEVKVPADYGYSLSGDDESDDAFDSADSMNDIDIVPEFLVSGTDTDYHNLAEQKREQPSPSQAQGLRVPDSVEQSCEQEKNSSHLAVSAAEQQK